MGGADIHNITENIISLCNEYNHSLQHKIIFDVIIGKANKNYERIKQIITEVDNFNLYYNLNFIGDVLKEADLCIGAPGSTSYERCIMKIPSLCICIAENQKEVLDKFIISNTMKYLGTIDDSYGESLMTHLKDLNNNIDELRLMSIQCDKLINLKSNQLKYILSVDDG